MIKVGMNSTSWVCLLQILIYPPSPSTILKRRLLQGNLMKLHLRLWPICTFERQWRSKQSNHQDHLFPLTHQPSPIYQIICFICSPRTKKLRMIRPKGSKFLLILKLKFLPKPPNKILNKNIPLTKINFWILIVQGLFLLSPNLK